MSDFVNRLKAAMDRAGLKPVDLHNRTGISKSTISEYLSGNYEPKQKNIYKLATALGILPSELMGIEPPPPSLPITKLSSEYCYRIPLLGRVAAGEPIYADERIEGYEFIEERYKDDGFDYFALRIQGRSMEPTIMDGDTVIVRQQSTVDNGQIAIVLIDGEDATAKEVKEGPEGITLIGHNTSVYTPHHYTPREVMELPVQVIGKVIEIRRRIA